MKSEHPKSLKEYWQRQRESAYCWHGVVFDSLAGHWCEECQRLLDAAEWGNK